MTSQTITADFTTTINAFGDDDVIVVAKGVEGSVEGVAIDASIVASNRTFIIDGQVVSHTVLDSVALDFTGRGGNFLCNGAAVKIGRKGALIAEDTALRLAVVGFDLVNDGMIRADAALSGTTQGADIVNHGSIIGGDEAIDLRGGNVHILNDGLIRAAPDDLVTIGGGIVVKLGGGGNVIRNHGTIEQRGDVQVVEFDSSEGNANLLVNHGRIKGGSSAVVGRDGDEKIVNFGRFDGGVSLNEGDDILVNRGTIGSTIFGGAGDDQYFLYDHEVELGADTDGFDSVTANISIRLADGIEDLTLVGRRDIDGMGNDTKNVLVGNAGDNLLNGLDQNDELAGGLGDDRLIGGAGFDGFIFEDGFGRDTVADLELSADRIDLSGVSAAVDLETLTDFARATAKGVVIYFGLGDRLTLLDLTVKDLAEVNFLFFGAAHD